MTTAPQSNTRAAMFALTGYAIFSTHDAIIKFLGGNYSVVQIVFFSSLFSFPLITLLLVRDAEPGTLRPKHPWLVALRSVSGSIAAFTTFYAFTVLPLAQVYAILFATPLIITLLAIPFLGETVRLRRGLAVVAGLLGVLVVLRPGTQELQTGHLAALVGACLAAGNAIIMRKIGGEERTVVMILYPLFVGFLFMGGGLAFVYQPMPARDLGLLAVIGALVLLAMMSILAAYRNGPAIIVAPMQYSQIIWAVLFGFLFFGEYPDAITFVGTGIIIASGLYILRRESDPDVSRNSPVLRTRTRAGLPAGLRIGSLMRSDD
ncbi:MAG: DMT family transporter [Paracoccaceae bacterium]